MKIQVAIPCYNEELSIAKVIQDFRRSIPEAEIVVYDNASQDTTTQKAREAGARVVFVNRRGKGYVIQEIFERSDNDIVVLVDGDDTYEAEDVRLLIKPIEQGSADMTIGTRLHTQKTEFKSKHFAGNKMITGMLNKVFNTEFSDVLSGYRAVSKRFMKEIPLISTGFQIEVELVIQALEKGFAVQEIPIRFRRRPQGSFSKLSSFKDGYKILIMIIVLLRDHRPLFVFTFIGGTFILAGFLSWLYGFVHMNDSPGLAVFRNAGVVITSFGIGLFLVGLILNTINTRMRELISLLQRKK